MLLYQILRIEEEGDFQEEMSAHFLGDHNTEIKSFLIWGTWQSSQKFSDTQGIMEQKGLR